MGNARKGAASPKEGGGLVQVKRFVYGIYLDRRVCQHCGARLDDVVEVCPSCKGHVGPSPKKAERPLAVKLAMAIMMIAVWGIVLSLLVSILTKG